MGRPVGVTILAILDFLGAAFCLLGGLAALLGGGFIATVLSQRGEAGGGLLAGLGAALGVVIIIFGVIAGLIGFGLWKLKGWARWVTVILAGLGALSNLLGVITHFNIGSLIVLAIDGLIIWYMFQPNVKAAFEGGTARAVSA